MTVYMPLLKAKPGEFEAIGELTPATLNAIRPVFELCPGPDEDKVLDQAIAKATKTSRPVPWSRSTSPRLTRCGSSPRRVCRR